MKTTKSKSVLAKRKIKMNWASFLVEKCWVTSCLESASHALPSVGVQYPVCKTHMTIVLNILRVQNKKVLKLIQDTTDQIRTSKSKSEAKNTINLEWKRINEKKKKG